MEYNCVKGTYKNGQIFNAIARGESH